MPYKLIKKANGRYRVTGPSGVHADDTTLEKAKAQIRLLNAVEHGLKLRRKTRKGK